MKQATHSRSIAARALLPAALMVTSLAMALPAAAEPGAADARYDAYIEQEAANEQAEGAGSQTVSTGVGSSGGIVIYSQLPNSPLAFGNADQHEQGR